jgi:hypothetical protein
MGELFVFVYRVVDETLQPQHCIFALETTEYSVDATALAGLIQEKLQSQLGITRTNIKRLVAVTTDSASVNRKANTKVLVCIQVTTGL